MKYIVYLTRNNINGKIYIGIHQTEDPNIFDGYYGCGISLRNKQKLSKPTTPLAKAIKKYGFGSFTRIILQICDTLEEACEKEAILVDEAFIKRDDTYNVCLGGGVPPNLSKQVYQYDLYGNFLNKYKSLEEASKIINKASNTICNAIYSKGICAGFYWSYTKFNKLIISDYKKQQNIPIHLYDESGDYIRSYNSISKFCQEFHTKNRFVRMAISRRVIFKNYYISFDKLLKYSINNKKNKFKKVFQYNLNGDLITDYLTIRDAAKNVNGIVSGINRAVKLQRPYKNYLWTYGDDPIKLIINKPLFRMKKVGRFSLTGELLEEFISIRKAQQKWGGSVPKVLSGKMKQTRGFVFKYMEVDNIV